jgi:hypothetical protein
MKKPANQLRLRRTCRTGERLDRVPIVKNYTVKVVRLKIVAILSLTDGASNSAPKSEASTHFTVTRSIQSGSVYLGIYNCKPRLGHFRKWTL